VHGIGLERERDETYTQKMHQQRSP
jgi:hypothetical protein